MSALPDSSQQLSTADAESPAKPAKPRMSTRNRFLFFFTGWLIVLMPFLFWWNTWFGRQLSDKQLHEYLLDDKKPRHIQHALVQIGERVARHDAGVTHWYPDVVRLASYPIEEVRNTDAWVMGQDTTSKDASSAGFHQALLKMLDDPSLMVRGNAALSLVRFGDATGRPQIVALLQPAKVIAPQAGKITDASAVGTVIHQGGIIVKIESDGQHYRGTLAHHRSVARAVSATWESRRSWRRNSHARSGNRTGMGSTAGTVPCRSARGHSRDPPLPARVAGDT